ncbi:hypothetical protein [Luteimicrobium subarcticum]|uniref:hypothetical protein n=1 Tax=Luteimicrobium subarcticum TaxID=620910 RepID=UPI0012FE4410|nr:hypothetical protein [Luteimicrobium subarcticum]
MWAGQDGVRLLDFAQHSEQERESLDRFPRLSDGTIAWSQVPEDLVTATTSDLGGLGVMIQDLIPEGTTVILFWDSLAIPSVAISRDAFIPLASRVADSIPEFWVYVPATQMVIEVTFSGSITAGRVPPVDR